MNIMRRVPICVLLGVMAWGQAASQSPATQVPAAPPGNMVEKQPDQAVITIRGLCDKAKAGGADSNCATVITRAEFEKMLGAVAPDMPMPAQRRYALRYANALVLAQRAHEMGLDQGPEFEEHMRLARIQVLSEELNQATQKKFSVVSDQDVENYYRSGAASYEVADLQRIYIPRIQQLPTAKNELSASEDKKRTEESENKMKAEADKLHARAVAGEDFDKLQQEALELAGIKSGPPKTSMKRVVRGSLPPSQVSAMDLKTGEISAVLSDQSGYFIYKIGVKDIKPLSEVRDEIRETLRAQRTQEALQAIQQSGSPALDEGYFGAEGVQ
jgi:hypothetical protein